MEVERNRIEVVWTRGLWMWRLAILAAGVWTFGTLRILAQSPTFGGNAQHTAQYPAVAQNLNHLRWSAAIQSTLTFAHYGAPVISASNTVFFGTIAGNTFTLNALEGPSGRVKYTLPSGFRSPNGWGLGFGPVLTAGPDGTRLYYPGAGGTVYYIDEADSDTPTAPVQLCFYMPMADYATNAAAFNNAVLIDTAITADTNGVIFFGFRVIGTAPAPLNTTNGGIVRIAPDGSASYVLAPAASGDSLAYQIPFNCTPALSADGSTLYVAAAGNTAYLLGLHSTTLATKYQVLLRDPRNGNNVNVPDNSTASPTVGPDGDVFLGATANPDNGTRGFMFHFSADLGTQKLPSSFGWDYTAAIVPTNVVRGYKGPSSYLLMSKYNSYGNADYRVALLDPNAAETAFGTNVMREVLTMQSPGGREWCLNTPAVDLATASVFMPSEDGRIYRWNLLSNSLAEAFSLNAGFGEPYIPTVIGPDGAIYTINGARLYAIDSRTNLAISASSSIPDDRSAVVGQPITFVARVTNPATNGPVPTGTVAFLNGTAVIVTNLMLTNAMAAVTVTNLAAGFRFINVQYSGDAFYPTGKVTLIQRVHAKSSSMVLNSSVPVAGSNSVTFTAAVSSPGGGTPTGMVSFWDGNRPLGQLPLTSGVASLATTDLGVGGHAVQAEYSSDANYAWCSGSVGGVPGPVTSIAVLPDGSFQFAFTNASGSPWVILRASDVTQPLSNWEVLGSATEIFPGQFQFIDSQAAAYRDNHYYRARSP